MTSTFALLLLVAIFGLMIGSFLNVVIYRVPKGENIAFPASHCQNCHTPLKWYHNIPLFSWILLGGKCTFCHTNISKQYPIVEFLTAIIFLLLYQKIGITWYFPFVAFSFTALFALTMIDFKYMAVPDSINFAALLLAYVQPDYIDALLNAAMAAGGLYAIGLFSSLLARKQAMGGADVIVAGTMGALLGFPHFFVALFLSALLAMLPALIWRERGVPFVPFLALATFIVYLYDTKASQLLEKVIYG